MWISRSCLSKQLILQHGALHDLLYQLAAGEGVTFRFDSRVTRVDPEAGTLSLENGDEISADLIVGADGCHSQLRQYIEHHQDYQDHGDQQPKAANHMVVLSFVVSGKDLKDDQDFLRSSDNGEVLLIIHSVFLSD